MGQAKGEKKMTLKTLKIQVQIVGVLSVQAVQVIYLSEYQIHSNN